MCSDSLPRLESKAVDWVGGWYLSLQVPQEGWEGPVPQLCGFAYTVPSGKNALPPEPPISPRFVTAELFIT